MDVTVDRDVGGAFRLKNSAAKTEYVNMLARRLKTSVKSKIYVFPRGCNREGVKVMSTLTATPGPGPDFKGEKREREWVSAPSFEILDQATIRSSVRVDVYINPPAKSVRA